MLKKYLSLIIFSLLFLQTSNSLIINPEIILDETNKPIGRITIPKIHLSEYIYPVESEENTIERHVTILKESIPPNQENSIFILAAHSGTGPLAYFEELDQIQLEDEITLNYQGINYTYVVKEIWEEKKNGVIHLKKELENQLILTTCSPKKENKQLIISCIKKEST